MDNSVVGVLILGIIQTIIVFEGTLGSWWTKVVIGILSIIILQRIIDIRSNVKKMSSWNINIFKATLGKKI